MFLGIVFVIIGGLLLLNSIGIIAGNFWGLFWAIIFLAIGIKLLAKNGNCPVCGWQHWEAKIHQKMHEHSHENKEGDNH